MNQLVEAGLSIALAIVGVTTLAVILSKNANTVNVLGAAGKAFNGALSTATAPVTGGGTMPSFPISSLGASSPFGFGN